MVFSKEAQLHFFFYLTFTKKPSLCAWRDNTFQTVKW